MTETTKEDTTFSQWAILELFGHRRLAGLVTEEQIAGKGFLRLDVPASDGGKHYDEERWAATQYYSPDSVYCLTPTTEEIARKIATQNRPAPVTRWELERAPDDDRGAFVQPKREDLEDAISDDDDDVDDDDDDDIIPHYGERVLTSDESRAVLSLVTGYWPHPAMQEDEVRTWMRQLVQCEHRLVAVQAVDALALEREYRPNAAMFFKAYEARVPRTLGMLPFVPLDVPSAPDYKPKPVAEWIAEARNNLAKARGPLAPSLRETTKGTVE